jgi:hypothetical protein
MERIGKAWRGIEGLRKTLATLAAGDGCVGQDAEFWMDIWSWAGSPERYEPPSRGTDLATMLGADDMSRLGLANPGESAKPRRKWHHRHSPHHHDATCLGCRIRTALQAAVGPLLCRLWPPLVFVPPPVVQAAAISTARIELEQQLRTFQRDQATLRELKEKGWRDACKEEVRVRAEALDAAMAAWRRPWSRTRSSESVHDNFRAHPPDEFARRYVDVWRAAGAEGRKALAAVEDTYHLEKGLRRVEYDLGMGD